MLEIKVIMNSCVEEVLGFKCCNLSGMNLEIIIHNRGNQATVTPDFFVLENESGTETFRNLYPPWPQTIAPGDCTAQYCNMDENCWQKYRTLIISDKDGRPYRIPIDRD
jgi:hypothetical protein